MFIFSWFFRSDVFSNHSENDKYFLHIKLRCVSIINFFISLKLLNVIDRYLKFLMIVRMKIIL